MPPRFASSGLLALLLLGACVSVPEGEALQFAVDDAELREPRFERALERVATALREDPALHLLIVGHADEDNSDEYNRALSQRRAEHVRARLLALEPELAERLQVEARGEWDASDPGTDEAAKARNRRVELRFFYPRQCEPSFDAMFVACEWARLPAPAPVVVAAPEPQTEPEPPPAPAAPTAPREQQGFRGPYLFGLGGYAISSGEHLRQHARWGLGGGYLWGFGSEFRIAAGLQFDHLVDLGFLFPQPDSCRPFCDRIDRSRIRVVPELRVGGARGGVWGWLRISAGLQLEHRERGLLRVDGETMVVAPERWTPGPVVGIGPGVAITLTRHLFLLFDATVTYSATRGTGGTAWSGSGIYDAGAGLGWMF
ncbi:MAG: OmpA family protein [Enhygromyxa sp.]